MTLPRHYTHTSSSQTRSLCSTDAGKTKRLFLPQEVNDTYRCRICSKNSVMVRDDFSSSVSITCLRRCSETVWRWRSFSDFSRPSEDKDVSGQGNISKRHLRSRENFTKL